MNKEEKNFLEKNCKEIRRLILREIAAVGKGHVGGSLSIVEVLVVLYYKEMNIDSRNPKMIGRDRFILSKGHAGPAVYAILAHSGFISEDDLFTLNKNNTKLPSHCDMNKTPGIDMTTGSLGQGFSCAIGMAKASKIKKDNAYIYCIIGDGECEEGQIWEGALAAAQFKLNNLIAFVDYNKLQLDGPLVEIIDIPKMKEKWKAFGWHVEEVNGHDVEEIYEAIEKSKNQQKPSMIVLNTIKGKGVSFIEEAGFKNHSMDISEETLKKALMELE